MRKRGKAKSVSQPQDSVLAPRTAVGKTIWQSRSEQIVTYLGIGLITGSARLEIFNRVGDSLAGRFFLHRLMPLSPAECAKMSKKAYALNRFLERGGFPEPFFS
jgi:hypothetical protein